MKIFNQILQGIFLLIVGTATCFSGTGAGPVIITEDRTNPSMVNNLDATDIIALSAYFRESNISVCNFIIKSLPSETLGTLYMADGTTPITVGQQLTKGDSIRLTFDPVKSCTPAEAKFTYVGITGTQVEGTVGTFTIPLTVMSGCTQVVSDDKRNFAILNSLGAIDIIDLSGEDINGDSVTSFIIKSLPSVSGGVLTMGDGETAVREGQVLTFNEAGGLRFDPVNNFVGDVNFTYMAVDSNNIRGNLATVILPVVASISEKPIAENRRNDNLLNSLGAVNILDLSGKDSDGDSVNNFVITSLPNRDRGILYMADGTTAITLNQVLTEDEADGLKFDPDKSFVGEVKFTYVAMDDNGVKSEPATVIIPLVSSVGGSVSADDKVNSEMFNTLDAVNILNLSGKDSNGDDVNSFIITSLPKANQGILYMEDGTTAVELNQTLTIEDADELKFDPNDTFVGNVTFTYVAVDDNGLKSNNATVTIPLVKPVANNAPVADDKSNPEMLNSLGAVNILNLSGKDSNGNKIDSFIITSLPSANQGVLYMADGTTKVELNQTLTLEEANGLKFNPSATFTGDVKFTYVAVDDKGVKSATSTVTIPLVSSHNTDIVIHNDNAYANGGADPIVINVLANDTGTLSTGTVYLIDNNGNLVQNLDVEGEGIWSVDGNNVVTFTPVAPFVGTPSSVLYLVLNKNKGVSNTATITISGRCVCKAYKEDVPIFNALGLLLMFVLSTILGSLLIKREILD